MNLLLLAVGLAAFLQDGAASQPSSRPTSQPTGPVVWSEDFDAATPVLRRWQLSGRVKGVPMPVDGTTIPGVAGRCYVLTAEAGAQMTRAENLPPLKMADVRELVLRVDPVSASAESPVVLEYQFLTKGRAIWRGRRMRFTKPGWQEVRVPLVQALSVGEGYISWANVVNFGIRLRSSSTVAFDGIELRGAPLAAELSTSQLGQLAFGERKYQRWYSQTCIVLTDSTELSEKDTLAAVDLLRQAMRADFPNRSFSTMRPHVLVFAKEEDYRALWPRLGEVWNRTLPRPTTDGYSMNGVAATFCAKDDPSKVRPVFAHEVAHVMFANLVGIEGSNWISEGFATRYQVTFSGQDIGAVIRTGLSEPGRRIPLLDMLRSNKLEPGRYWQAYTLVEYLMRDEDRTKFNPILNELRRLGIADMSTMIRKTWGIRPKPFEKAWLEWSQARWGE